MIEWPGLFPGELAFITDEGFAFARPIAEGRYLRTEFVGPDQRFDTETDRAERVKEWHAILDDYDQKATG